MKDVAVTPPDKKPSETKRIRRKGSLADSSGVNRGSGPESEPLALPISEAMPIEPPPVGSESGLDVASKFGFMFESCILASRQGGELVCPAHKDHPLSVEDIAPDVVRIGGLYTVCTC